MSTLRKALFALALTAVACAFVLPQSGIALLLRTAVLGVAEAAILCGVRTYRPQRSLQSHLLHPDPWVLLGVGLVLRGASDAIAFFAGEGAAVADGARSLLGLTMLAVTGIALVDMLRQRFGDRATDHCFEAVISAGTVSMGLWVTVFEPVLRRSGVAVDLGLPGAIAVTIACVMAGLSLHLVTSFENRQPAFVALSVGETIPVITTLLAFVGDHTGASWYTSAATSLPAFSLAFVGFAALEPSMALYEEPSGPAGARLGRLRLTGLILPVLLGPITLTLCLTDTLELSPLAIAAYTIALSLLVVGHLVAMVQARASSTHWASHDKLTGLPNRALFRERTAQALERARKTGQGVAILYLDLDRFKHVNDSMGHEAGDQLLEQVAKRVLSCVQGSDTVARLGGDEFAVLLPAIDDENVPRALARAMLKTFSAPFNLKPRPVFMSPSVGIAVSEANVSLETLLTQADTAMYRAKESGRNNFAVWSQEMNEAAKQRLMLETHLHSAIANDELRLVYQPKVELATGRVVGVEALIRWHHPKLGTISPGAFIHLAEESGLINQIGEWVLVTACQQGRAWFDAGYEHLTVAVNLSSRQFQQTKVADLVSRTLRQTGLPAHLLELELTESVAMSGDDATLSTLRELREMGVKTSIDDFGTGYSNLSYLSRFPIDNLKIDKSFIDQIDQSGGDAAIVVAVIAMAHGLGLNVIAEGVETPQQASFLARHDCDEMQGYLFSKPLPPEEVDGLMMIEQAARRAGAAEAVTTRAAAPAARAQGAPRRLEREIPARERLAATTPLPQQPHDAPLRDSPRAPRY